MNLFADHTARHSEEQKETNPDLGYLGDQSDSNSEYI